MVEKERGKKGKGSGGRGRRGKAAWQRQDREGKGKIKVNWVAGDKRVVQGNAAREGEI